MEIRGFCEPEHKDSDSKLAIVVPARLYVGLANFTRFWRIWIEKSAANVWPGVLGRCRQWTRSKGEERDNR